MAKILWTGSALVSGSIAGTTYAHVAGIGSTARRRTRPVRVRTNRNAQLQTAFTKSIQDWNNLSDAERLAWKNYGLTVIKTTPFGTRSLSGREAFLGPRSIINYAVQRGIWATGPIDAAPLVPGSFNVGDLGPVTLIGPGTGIAFAATNETGKDGALFINVSGPYNPTRLAPPSRWDGAKTVMGALVDNASTKFEIIGLTAGLVYFVRIRPVQTEDANKISSETILRIVATTV